MAKKDYTAQRDDYMTPQEIYRPLLQLIEQSKFSIDVCCSEANIPADRHFFSNIYDGLHEVWGGYCFLNPPFALTQRFVRKAVRETSVFTTTVAVLPADRLETKYYQECILQNERCMFAFLPGKVGFINPDDKTAKPIPSQKIMIVIFSELAGIYKDKWNMLRLFNTIAFRGGIQ